MEASNSDLFQRLRLISKGEILSTCRLIPPASAPLRGISEVTVIDDQESSITLFERGRWLGDRDQGEIVYTNALRFRLLESTNIALEHLRYGKERPIQILELHRVSLNHYKSLAPHVCKEDIYSGDVLFDEHFVHLNWQIKGPKKSITLRAVYTSF